jgi:Ca2+-binding RTX toxin-like protein
MTRRRVILVAALACGLLSSVASTAGAATVAVHNQAAVYTAAPGEANRLTVQLVSQTYHAAIFTDDGAIIKAGPGCVAAVHYAICPSVQNRLYSSRVLYVDIDTGDADDTIKLLSGSGRIDVGSGDDRVDMTAESNPTQGFPPYSSVSGGAGDDELLGGPNAEDFDGGPGNDVIKEGAGTGPGVIQGGSGDDQLFGGDGYDAFDGGPGADTISGGDSYYIGDGVIYETRTAAVDVTLDGVANDGEAGEHDNVMPDVETIIGGEGPDRLVGDPTDVAEPSANFYALAGRGGDDVLIGGSASETIAGFDGNDILIGNGGDDHMIGHAGDDTLYARDGGRDGEVSCGDGSDSVQLDASLDYPHDCETLLP